MTSFKLPNLGLEEFCWPQTIFEAESKILSSSMEAIGFGKPHVHRPAYVSLVVADVVVPNRRQDISNNHHGPLYNHVFVW